MQLRRGRCCCCCCCNWLGGAAASPGEGMHGCACAAALLRLTQQRAACACACLPHAPLCQQLRDGVVPVPVHLDYEQPDFGPALDAAAAAAAAQGHRVAALLLTHPHNPRGTLYSRQQLASMLEWCLRHKRHCLRCGSCGAPGSMHAAANTASMRCCSFHDFCRCTAAAAACVSCGAPRCRRSDEVYANSVFATDTPLFVSMAHVAAEQAAGMQGGEHAGGRGTQAARSCRARACASPLLSACGHQGAQLAIDRRLLTPSAHHHAHPVDVRPGGPTPCCFHRCLCLAACACID